MSRSVVLIAAVSAADYQVLLQGQRRGELALLTVSGFHQRLVAASAAGAPLHRIDGSPEIAAWPREVGVLPDEDDLVAPWVLYPAFVAPVLAWLEEKGWALERALVVGVGSGGGEEALEHPEPSLLAAWLAEERWWEPPAEAQGERLPLSPVCWGRVEAQGGDDTWVGVLDRWIGQLRQAHPRAAVVVAGAPSRLREAVVASARFRFGDRWVPTGPDLRPPPPDALQVLRIKEHARGLLRQGRLDAAWGLARPLAPPLVQGAGTERAWVQALGEVVAFLEGRLEGEAHFAPLRALQRPRLRCLVGALRVEALLRAGRREEALEGTLAFAGAALWDALGRYAEGRGGELRGGCLRLVTPPPAKLTQRTAAGRAPLVFERSWQGGEEYRIDASEGCRGVWLEVVQGGAALQALWAALEAREEPVGATPRAVAIWMERGVWSERLRQPPPYDAPLFFGAPAMMAVLDAFEVPHPAACYDLLLDALIAAMEAGL